MADKLESEDSEHAGALWVAKGSRRSRMNGKNGRKRPVPPQRRRRTIR
jgi:hypothetical protein